MKSDKDICREKLKSPENEGLFIVEAGGKNTKPVPRRIKTKSKEEIKIENRIKSLEKKVKTLYRQLSTIKGKIEPLIEASMDSAYSPSYKQKEHTNENQTK